MSNFVDVYNQRYMGDYRDHLYGYEFARWEALNHFIPNIVEIAGAKMVLDYGAGCGLHIELWEKVFTKSKLHFCEISTVAREKCIAKYPQYAGSYHLVHNNRADFDDNSFDAIVSVEVMEHVEDLTAYLQDICRLLKPGGRFVWTTPCANELSIEHIYSLLLGKIETTDEGYNRWSWEEPTHLRRLKSREIKSLLEINGFDGVLFRLRSHFFSFFCTNCPPRGRFIKLRNKLMTLDYGFFRRLPNGASMIGSARKMMS